MLCCSVMQRNKETIFKYWNRNPGGESSTHTYIYLFKKEVKGTIQFQELLPFRLIFACLKSCFLFMTVRLVESHITYTVGKELKGTV